MRGNYVWVSLVMMLIAGGCATAQSNKFGILDPVEKSIRDWQSEIT